MKLNLSIFAPDGAQKRDALQKRALGALLLEILQRSPEHGLTISSADLSAKDVRELLNEAIAVAESCALRVGGGYGEES